MKPSNTGTSILNSRLSFAPLVETWEKIAIDGRPGARKLYQILLDRIKRHPELLEPIDDISLLKEHEEWVDLLMATLFPVSSFDQHAIFGVGIPFSQEVIYSSNRFRALFLKEDGRLDKLPEKMADKHLLDEKAAVAYKLILSRYYGQQIDGNVTSILQFPQANTGLTGYFELELDPTFIRVHALEELPVLPDLIHCASVSEVLQQEKLQAFIPLEKFRFEGITIVRIREVTHREAMNNIKNLLREPHIMDLPDNFLKLEKEVKSLLNLKDLKIGVTPFFQVNDHPVLPDQFTRSSLALHGEPSDLNKDWCCRFQELFKPSDSPLLFSALDDIQGDNKPLAESLQQQGYNCALCFPLKSDGKWIGLLSVVHPEKGALTLHHMSELSEAIPLFVQAMKKAEEALDNEVDKVIKKHFTAVQRSVEWKFTDAALEYIAAKNNGNKAKIAPIVFEHVFPIYGAIDVRNSSVERSQAIQLDLLEQLQQLESLIGKARQIQTLPLLEEVNYRIEKFRKNVSNLLFSGDESVVDHFLRVEVVELLEHLRILYPSMSEAIGNYFSSTDPGTNLRSNHRKEFDESITLINQELSRFLDGEQESAQAIYPHYFERFVTDGIEFNMYIGQSICPGKLFDPFYLKNLKMWQIAAIIRASQAAHRLKDRLSHPLQTTQMILAHNQPISISFRAAERKFDVDGAYNIRYEIIKKRIDKVHLRNGKERLTQPGKLAIVYSQSKEAAEYQGFIEYFQSQGLLLHDLEQLELEELQGVAGLKALRVSINLEMPEGHSVPRTEVIEFRQN